MRVRFLLFLFHLFEIEIRQKLLQRNPRAVVFIRQNLAHIPLDRARDVVHVLGFDHGLDVILEEFGEVVLEFLAPEVRQDLLPVRRGGESPQVWLQFSRQYFKGCALPDAVGAHETEDLPRAGHRHAVKLERVLSVTVGGLGFEILG